MRAMEGLLLFIGAVLWGIAFYFGPEKSSWILGNWGIFLFAVSALLRVTEFLIPNRKPQPKRPRGGSVRKCQVCGKPAVTGSSFCSYHAKYGPEDGRN